MNDQRDIPQNDSINYKEDEISLRDIYLKLIEFKGELIKSWLLILITVFVFAGAGIAYSYIEKPVYIANTTMMLEGSEKGGMSKYMQLAGEFGMLSGHGETLNEGKLVELIESDYVIRTALLKKIEINDKKDYLANFIIDTLGLKKEWESNKLLKDFQRITNNDQSKLSIVENKVFQKLKKIILDEFLDVSVSSEGIISVTITAPFELLSQQLNLALIEGVSDFYLSNTTQKEKENVVILQKRLDSISSALSGAENRFAQWKDATNRVVKAKGSIEELRLKRDIEILTRMYGETIKNYEIAKFTLLQEEPIIQLIDYPYLPLREDYISKTKAFLFGAFAGGFLICVYIISRKIFRDAIHGPNTSVT